MRAYEIANMKQCIVGVSFIHGFICILVMWHSWKQQNETTIGISLRTTHSRDRGQIELAAAQLDPYHYDSFFFEELYHYDSQCYERSHYKVEIRSVTL